MSSTTQPKKRKSKSSTYDPVAKKRHNQAYQARQKAKKLAAMNAANAANVVAAERPMIRKMMGAGNEISLDMIPDAPSIKQKRRGRKAGAKKIVATAAVARDSNLVAAEALLRVVLSLLERVS